MSLIFLRSIFFIISLVFFGFLIDSFLRGISFLKNRVYEVFSFGKIPLYFALAAAVYTFLGTIFSIYGIKLSIIFFLFLLNLFLVLNLWLYGISFWTKTLPPENIFILFKADKKRLAFCSVILLIILLIALKMITRMAFPSFDIDLLGHLLMKAKILLSATYKDSLYFHDSLFANLHSKYPPMSGIVYNLLFLFVGGAYNSSFQVANHFILFFIGYTVYIFLRERIPHWQALLWFFICISAENYLKVLYLMDNVDVLLSLFFLLAACELFYFFERGKRYHLLTCAAAGAAAALLKNEGLLFSIYLISVFIFYIKYKSAVCDFKRKASSFFFLSIPIVFLIMPWWLYQLTLPSPEKIVALNRFSESWPYFGNTIRLYAGELFSLKWQGIFVFWISLILLSKTAFPKKIDLFSWLALTQLISYFLIFYLGQGKELADNIYAPSGLKRTIAHVYPLVLISAALMIQNLSQNRTHKSAES